MQLPRATSAQAARSAENLSTAEHCRAIDPAGAQPAVPNSGDEDNDSTWEVVDNVQEKVNDLKDEIKDPCSRNSDRLHFLSQVFEQQARHASATSLMCKAWQL